MNNRRFSWWSKLALASGIVAISFASFAQQPNDDDPLLNYSSSAGLTDPVTKLAANIKSGKVKLQYDPDHGYLVSLLKELNVAVDTQTLVFSKTSSQADNTSPQQPRALYFNDTVYVGWAQHDNLIDLISIDPNRGPIFFTIAQTKTGKPTFQRDASCLSCHSSSKTLNVPGLVIRSVFTTPEGRARQQLNTFIAGHNNPLSQRWGGWYVTGTHGEDNHMGNQFLYGQDVKKPDLKPGSNVTNLSDRFDTSKYLAPTSDTVALLVLDDAVRMENLFMSARVAALHATKDTYLTEPQKQHLLEYTGEQLVTYMLFRDEAPLHGPIAGTNDYQQRFESLGPFDSKGRSLRDFDLKTRLFKYPCNYRIYSDTFDSINPLMKAYVYKRFDEILTGKDQSRYYVGMSAEDRNNVLEILLDTKPDFKAYMKANDPSNA